MTDAGSPSFFATDVVALLELDPNQTHVPLPELCARLGLDPLAHEERVQAHALLAAGLHWLRADGAWGLRVDLVPLWLAGLDVAEVTPAAQERLALFQRECASMLWQALRPQGFGGEDGLIPGRFAQSPAEQAYAATQVIAGLARQQMLIERQIDRGALAPPGHAEPVAPDQEVDAPALTLARAVRRVAQAAMERTRRNEYPGVFSGLHRHFGIVSFRRMPPARLHEALEWLERWRGDLLGEPEPPPDI